jgi:D-3-phosphoglycerate dehydrogenase
MSATQAPVRAPAGGATYRVLVADQIAAEGLEPLRADGQFELVERTGLTGEELARAIQGMDAVIVRSAVRITRETLAYADRLKVIGRAGVGVDTIDVDAATERGIAVLNAPAGNTVSAAELTFALLLALVRRVPAADRSMRAGEWDRKSFSGTELYGKTLGLIGAGRIGGEVARRARAFGMRVVAYDPYVTEERAQTLEIELAELDAVLRRADVISIHVPLTESTAGLIGDAELAKMRPSAVLVNAARGGVVKEEAVVRALRERRLAGAAFDVYGEEPLPKDDPLRSLPNVVLTPHLGASTAEAQQNVAVEIAEAVRAALLDGDLSHAVNAPAVGGEEMRRLRPLFDLAERLGLLAAALVDDPVERVEVKYAGGSEGALRPLASSALVGVLTSAMGRARVNFVNALRLAEARGVEVHRVRLGAHADYAEYVELAVGTRGGDARAAGALIAHGHPRVVRIGDYHIDINPRGALVVLRNRDVPGVIGRVGTLLGDAGINIAEYHQARLKAGGQALAAINVDGRLSPDVVEALRRLPEVLEVRQVGLD